MLLVVAALVVRRRRILLARRPEGGRHAGRWEFPGGKVEPGEAAEEAIARELGEELGVTTRSARPFSFVHWRGERPEMLLLLLSCEVGGEPLARDGASIGWFTVAAARRLDLLAPDRALLEAVAERRPSLIARVRGPARSRSR
jgi:8-oxo-dGTP diphosphatase